MHPLSFLQKRTHLCAVARGREMFEHVVDMTPARFDFLVVLYKHERLLMDIRRRLGLARQTVWTMMERLVELGFITKGTVEGQNQRRIVLSFTEEGRRRMHQALSAAFSERRRPPTRHQRAPVAGGGNVGHSSDEREARRKSGRMVGKIYSSFAWALTGGGRKRRRRYLEKMAELIALNENMAGALGNVTPSFYWVDYRELADPHILVTSMRWGERRGRIERIVETKRVAFARFGAASKESSSQTSGVRSFP